MEVLKGAAAAALYGSRASNGAIVIKTKTGRSGQNIFTGSIATGTQELTRGPENIKLGWTAAEIQQWADLVNPGRFVTARYTPAQIRIRHAIGWSTIRFAAHGSPGIP